MYLLIYKCCVQTVACTSCVVVMSKLPFKLADSSVHHWFTLIFKFLEKKNKQTKKPGNSTLTYHNTFTVILHAIFYLLMQLNRNQEAEIFSFKIVFLSLLGSVSFFGTNATYEVCCSFCCKPLLSWAYSLMVWAET